MKMFHSMLVGLLLIIASVSYAQSDLPDETGFIKSLSADITDIDTAALQKLLDERDDVVLVDVRTPDEIAQLGGSIDAGVQSVNISRGWLELQITEAVPEKSSPIVVYCGTNQRSPLAAHTLEAMGYEEVYNYADGFFAWRDAGLPVTVPDAAVGTMLYSEPIEVAEGIWSAIGATAPPTFENSGHNNNLTFIVTDEGVIVINAGDNYLLAQALHDEIRQRTEQPVKFVILENGQGHAMLGMNYWQEQGAVVIAHEDAVEEIETRGADILDRMRLRNRDKSMGTQLSTPDRVIGDSEILELGGERLEIIHFGPTHSPGDILVWMPERKLVIAGDMAFHERLLPVFEDTDTAGWLESWEKFAALNAEVVIPGHGSPTTMKEVTLYTHDYLQYMRREIAEILDSGGSLIDAYKVDQSMYRHLDTFNELAGLNADHIYRSMEFQ